VNHTPPAQHATAWIKAFQPFDDTSELAPKFHPYKWTKSAKFKP